MDGTVNWAKREEGRVLRAGTCPTATGATGSATLAGVLVAADLAAAADVLAGALVLLVSAFNSGLLAVRAARNSTDGALAGG